METVATGRRYRSCPRVSRSLTTFLCADARSHACAGAHNVVYIQTHAHTHSHTLKYKHTHTAHTQIDAHTHSHTHKRTHARTHKRGYRGQKARVPNSTRTQHILQLRRPKQRQNCAAMERKTRRERAGHAGPHPLALGAGDAMDAVEGGQQGVGVGGAVLVVGGQQLQKEARL